MPSEECLSVLPVDREDEFRKALVPPTTRFLRGSPFFVTRHMELIRSHSFDATSGTSSVGSSIRASSSSASFGAMSANCARKAPGETSSVPLVPTPQDRSKSRTASANSEFRTASDADGKLARNLRALSYTVSNGHGKSKTRPGSV